jgi:hypothetical protein
MRKKRELVSVGSRDEFTHKLSFSGIKAYLKIGELSKYFERFLYKI